MLLSGSVLPTAFHGFLNLRHRNSIMRLGRLSNVAMTLRRWFDSSIDILNYQHFFSIHAREPVAVNLTA
jgi:hypothetical protein